MCTHNKYAHIHHQRNSFTFYKRTWNQPTILSNYSIRFVHSPDHAVCSDSIVWRIRSQSCPQSRPSTISPAPAVVSTVSSIDSNGPQSEPLLGWFQSNLDYSLVPVHGHLAQWFPEIISPLFHLIYIYIFFPKIARMVNEEGNNRCAEPTIFSICRRRIHIQEIQITCALGLWWCNIFIQTTVALSLWHSNIFM